jgi:outer membrane protein
MKHMVLLWVLLAGEVFAQSPVNLTLEDAIRMGRANSRVLRLSRTREDIAGGKAGAAGAALLPSLRFEGAYRHLSDVPPFSIQPPGFPRPFIVSPNVVDTYGMTVTLQQPLFTGFKLRSNARSAEELAEASSLDTRNDQEDVDVSITAYYLTLYQALETMKVTDENVNRLTSFLRDSENLLKAGLVTRNDFLKIQLQLNNARLQQIDATNDVEVARMNLNNAMGRPIDLLIQPVSVPGGSENDDTLSARKAPEAPPDLITNAIRNRADVLAMEARVEASRAGVMSASGNWWPQLFLMGSYYYSNPNVRYQPTLPQFKSTWDVGVNVRFDIFNWGQTAYETDQARAILAQSEIQLEQTRENVVLDVRRQYLALGRASDKVRVAHDGVDQAEENLRTFSDKFKSGVATSSDLLDANFSLVQARTNLTGALVEIELSRARMRRALGNPGGESMSDRNPGQ